MTSFALTHPLSRIRAHRRPNIFARFVMMRTLARQRRELAFLDDMMLEDIGVTRQEALQEAARPIWDSPAHWTC